MSSRYHGPMRYMGNFKAVAIDYEYYLSLSDEPKAVCLTERQMYVLTVQNTYTFWATRWYNIEDTSAAQLQLIAAEIEDLLMCGCGVPEPSLTDRYNTTTYSTTTYATYQETYNTWNDAGQTVDSIAPNLDYDGSNPPEDIDKLICLNLNLLLRTIVETAMKAKQMSDQESRDLVTNLRNVFAAIGIAAGAAMAGGGLLAAAAAFFMAPELILGMAIMAVAAASVVLLAATDLSVFQDAEAYMQVGCTMVANMTGAQLTRARFMAGLDPNEFEPGSNAEKLAAIVQPYLNDLNVYLQFLSTGNGLYDAADIGALPDCVSCPPPGVLHIVAAGGFEAWGSEYRGLDGDGNEKWRLTRLVNTGSAPCVMVDDVGNYFRIISNTIVVGNFTDQVAWVTLPSPAYGENFTGIYPDDITVYSFYRFPADGALPQIFDIVLEYAGHS